LSVATVQLRSYSNANILTLLTSDILQLVSCFKLAIVTTTIPIQSFQHFTYLQLSYYIHIFALKRYLIFYSVI